jgi:hypothetical protein
VNRRAAVKKQITDQVGGPIWNRINSPIEKQVWCQSRSLPWLQVFTQVENPTKDQIKIQVWSQVWGQAMEDLNVSKKA